MSAEEVENNGNGNGVKLYYWYTSFYSQRVLMTLYEKNLKFRTHVVSLFALEQYESWFLRLNPRGEVPVLIDGVKVIPDSNRIIEYLEDNFSNGKHRPLAPKDKGSEESKNIEKYRTLLETVPVPSLTYGSAANPEFLENPKPPFTSAILSRMKEVAKSRHLLLRDQAKKNPEFSETLLAKAEEAEKGALNLNKTKEEMELVYMNVDETFEIIEEELASHGEEHSDWWLCGEMFSIADIDLAVLLNRLYQLGFEKRFWEGKRSHVEAYWKRVQERESFKKATQVSPSVFRLTIFRSILQRNKTYLVTLATALGIAVTSFLVYKRIQHT